MTPGLNNNPTSIDTSKDIPQKEVKLDESQLIEKSLNELYKEREKLRNKTSTSLDAFKKVVNKYIINSLNSDEGLPIRTGDVMSQISALTDVGNKIKWDPEASANRVLAGSTAHIVEKEGKRVIVVKYGNDKEGRQVGEVLEGFKKVEDDFVGPPTPEGFKKVENKPAEKREDRNTSTKIEIETKIDINSKIKDENIKAKKELENLGAYKNILELVDIFFEILNEVIIENKDKESEVLKQIDNFIQSKNQYIYNLSNFEKKKSDNSEEINNSILSFINGVFISDIQNLLNTINIKLDSDFTLTQENNPEQNQEQSKEKSDNNSEEEKLKSGLEGLKKEIFNVYGENIFENIIYLEGTILYIVKFYELLKNINNSENTDKSEIILDYINKLSEIVKNINSEEEENNINNIKNLYTNLKSSGIKIPEDLKNEMDILEKGLLDEQEDNSEVLNESLKDEGGEKPEEKTLNDFIEIIEGDKFEKLSENEINNIVGNFRLKLNDFMDKNFQLPLYRIKQYEGGRGTTTFEKAFLFVNNPKIKSKILADKIKEFLELRNLYIEKYEISSKNEKKKLLNSYKSESKDFITIIKGINNGIDNEEKINSLLVLEDEPSRKKLDLMLSLFQQPIKDYLKLINTEMTDEAKEQKGDIVLIGKFIEGIKGAQFKELSEEETNNLISNFKLRVKNFIKNNPKLDTTGSFIFGKTEINSPDFKEAILIESFIKFLEINDMYTKKYNSGKVNKSKIYQDYLKTSKSIVRLLEAINIEKLDDDYLTSLLISSNNYITGVLKHQLKTFEEKIKKY